MSPAAPRRKLPPWVLQAMGYCLSAVCLFVALHKYQFNELIPAIRSLDWWWVTAAVLCDLSVYVVHGIRWNTLLEPVAKLRLWRTVQSIYIGLFANEVLPLRVGELIRCYLLSHWTGLNLSVTFASAAVERVIDGCWMLTAFLITTIFVKKIPRDLTILVQLLAGLLLVCVIVLVWIIKHKHHAHMVIRESKWAAALRHVVEGLHLMGNRRTLTRTALISLVYLLLQYLTVYMMMRAYLLDYSFWVAAGVLTIVRLATVVPNAPGNIGLMNIACITALRLFDLGDNDAKTFSIILFFASTLPLLLGGAVATALTGSKIGELRDRARQGLEAHNASPPARG
ncbi:MAG TPA: lysylphosphatidylglycerol synthase transmembrane domain-containing protein [Bryobacteraceae bacterium]|nr:lysylphosphatidylglycerol synthase transmembrane domain-containing protein [Bryobacteraceae bacterium]